MLPIRSLLLATLPIIPLVAANTPLSDAVVQDSLTTNFGKTIAMASRPLWHFGRSQNQNPCYPSAALIYGQQHGTNPDSFPRAGTGCPAPGGSFPTYFTVTKCGDNELRVVYHLYYSHDGFDTGGIALPHTGHMHDWERIIVIWARGGDSNWTRKQLLKSFHAGYQEDKWPTVQNTINYDNLDEQGGQDKDGAKIYCGWGKHANFDDRSTGWNDAISQGCLREFRSQDWRYLPTEQTLIPAGRGTPDGEAIAKFSWGSADSTPVVMESRVCDAKPGFTAC